MAGSNHAPPRPRSEADGLAARLGTWLTWGSRAGTAVACLAVVGLCLLGEPVFPWKLGAAGFLEDRVGWLRALAGLGIGLLGATPVGMLAMFGLRSLRARRWRSVCVALGLFAVLTAGGWLALSAGV